MLDTNSDAVPVCCEIIDKRAPGPIALPMQTAPDPWCRISQSSESRRFVLQTKIANEQEGYSDQ